MKCNENVIKKRKPEVIKMSDKENDIETKEEIVEKKEEKKQSMPEYSDEDKELADAFLGDEKEEEKEAAKETKEPAQKKPAKAKGKKAKEDQGAAIYALRTTANREDQVIDFVASNAAKKKLAVYSIIKPHEMRGYILMEAGSKADAEQAAFNIPYARGILPNPVGFHEIEHMLELVKVQMNIMKNDIVEIISGPFKRENAKISRIDRTKEEVVVELLDAAVPIPITVKMDSVKVIRRDKTEEEAAEEDDE